MCLSTVKNRCKDATAAFGIDTGFCTNPPLFTTVDTSFLTAVAVVRIIFTATNTSVTNHHSGGPSQAASPANPPVTHNLGPPTPKASSPPSLQPHHSSTPTHSPWPRRPPKPPRATKSSSAPTPACWTRSSAYPRTCGRCTAAPTK
jgi:hypothetical protein